MEAYDRQQEELKQAEEERQQEAQRQRDEFYRI